MPKSKSKKSFRSDKKNHRTEGGRPTHSSRTEGARPAHSSRNDRPSFAAAKYSAKPGASSGGFRDSASSGPKNRFRRKDKNENPQSSERSERGSVRGRDRDAGHGTGQGAGRMGRDAGENRSERPRGMRPGAGRFNRPNPNNSGGESSGFERVPKKLDRGDRTSRPSGGGKYPGNRERFGGKRGGGGDRDRRPIPIKINRLEGARSEDNNIDGKEPRGGVETVTGEVQKNARGFAFLLHKPEDFFIPASLASKMISGDKVKAWINPRNKEVMKVQILTHSLKKFIGTYEARMGNRVVLLTDKTMSEEVLIKEPPGIEGLRTGHKVLVEITSYEPRLEGKVMQTFGPTLAPKFDTLSVVVRSQWPQEFSNEAKADAENLSKSISEEAAKSGYKGRKDLREKHFVTIDGKDARDFDDAVLIEKTQAGYVLYVAIADVSEFVRPETTLNKEAYDRATSVYFPEWVIPMLPESLSNGACSLRPNEEKLTVTCEMHFDENGKKKSAKFYESVIRSHRRCIYEEVQKEFDAGEEFWKVPYALFDLIRISRNKRGSLDLDLPESKVVLDENSDTIDIKRTERLNAHRIIEEFMIAANESVTEIMEREHWPFVYRIHEPPQPEALERFQNFARALGFKPNLGEGIDPRLLSNFIETIKDSPFAQILYYLMLRSLKQARYDIQNLKHFGLASRAYTHFTSPIRRYPDLMVHRLLKMHVRHQHFNDEQKEEYLDYLAEACDHCSLQERKAEQLDRTVTKVKKARFMAKHFGETLDAIVTNVKEVGLFIELEKWFVDGLLPVAEIEGDFYEFIEPKLMLKGKRTGRKFKIGDKVQVCVLRVDQDNGLVDFTMAENLETSESNEDL